MADMNLGQVLHTDLSEPLDTTNKALHVHTSTGENVDLASVLTKLTELDNKIDAISNTNNMNVQQVGINVSLREIDATYSTTILAGSTVNVSILATELKIAKIKNLNIIIPGIPGSTGGQLLRVAQGNISYQEIFRISNDGISNIQIVRNISESGTLAGSLTNDIVQRNIINTNFDSSNSPLFVRYENNTDIDQIGSLVIRIVVEEVGVNGWL